MKRMFNLDKWTLLPEGKAMSFDLDRPRLVRIDVNPTGPVNLYVLTGDDTRFLARVVERDVLEFTVDGAFGLVADGDPVAIYTVDGQSWNFVDPAPEVFTRIHERRARNPELELIVAKMQQNMERRLAQQFDDVTAASERRERARALSSASGGSGGDVEDPSADAGTASRSKAARKPDKGSQDTGRRDDEE